MGRHKAEESKNMRTACLHGTRLRIVLVAFLLVLSGVRIAFAAPAIVRDGVHYSEVFGETRHYRIFLPPDYESSTKRYPVIYWFHGWSER
jgi:hypothetical protein